MKPSKPPQRDRILALLRRADGFVSGQRICAELGISRAAVWKQVEALRRQGYTIEGVSSQGYRLTGVPDRLGVLASEPGLRTRRVGTRILVREQTRSTNDDLWALARDGADEGTVVLAESQSAGRGRRGRQWASPPDRNLYLSVLLKPALCPAEVPLITLMAAVALCRSVEDLYPLAPRIKWPNDLLLGGKKAAGVLAEMHAEPERVQFIVLGIGVNLNMTPEMFPADIRYPATSVAIELGRPVERVPFARRLLENLDTGYDGLLEAGSAPVRDAWMGFCAHPDGWLEVNTLRGPLRGRFAGLDEEGAMLLREDGGRTRRVQAGDVARVEPPRDAGRGER